MTVATASPNLEIVTNGLPNICGWESEISSLVNQDKPVFLSNSKIDISQVNAGFACALHMHQPTIPAGQNGGLISNLQNMLDNPHDGDNHNGETFAWCYTVSYTHLTLPTKA